MKPGPMRRDKLPPDLEVRCLALWQRIKHLEERPFEIWELGFCRERQPAREIALYEHMAVVQETYMQRHPEVDAKTTWHLVYTISLDGRESRPSELSTAFAEIKEIWNE